MKTDNKAIATLRALAVEEINAAGSGHPGVALGAAPIVHTLFTRILRITPESPAWLNRDRFVLSAGHGSSLLYAALHIAGYPLTIADLKAFRQFGSKTPGHPEYGHTAGVDTTTGPLGQGVAMAVGMALAESHLHAKFPQLIDHYTYVLCGDGDLQEGVALEAASLAGRQALDKLIVLWDSNDIQLDGAVAIASTEDVKAKFRAMEWETLFVADGENIAAIEAAIAQAKQARKPVLIEIKTVIGRGSDRAGTHKVHGSPLSAAEVARIRATAGGAPFSVAEEVYALYRHKMAENTAAFTAWNARKKPQTFTKMANNKYKIDIDRLLEFAPGTKLATRAASGQIFNALSVENPRLIGGSADLISSTQIAGADGNFMPDHRLGRNICFGVREHAMGAIANGIALHGMLQPVVSGFFVFSDYLKPAIRLSALMGLPVIYVFTHDSVWVGEDGPTHQPIEHLTMLRSIPRLAVWRPADANETKVAYAQALAATDHPVALVLTRQNVTALLPNYREAARGGYVAKDFGQPEGIIIATGSEVELALQAAEQLAAGGTGVRVVSIPSVKTFLAQPQSYQNKVLPKKLKKRLIVELSEAAHLYQFVVAPKMTKVYNVTRFGASAPGAEVARRYGYTPEALVAEYRKL